MILRCGKLHRIAPLHHVIHFFPLIDLVDGLGGMVDQSHRRVSGVATRDTPGIRILFESFRLYVAYGTT